MVKQNSRYLQVGDKVYPMRIDVSLDKDKVLFQVVECDSCNGVQQPSFFKSEVVFPICKGKPAEHDPSQVEDTIGQVLAIDSGDDSQQQNGPADQNQNTATRAEAVEDNKRSSKHLRRNRSRLKRARLRTRSKLRWAHRRRSSIWAAS